MIARTILLGILASIFCAPLDADEVPLMSATRPRSTFANHRVLLAITDDDFLAVDRPLWCGAELEAALKTCREQREATSLSLEPIHAGSPASLRGGRVITTGPRRVLCLLCDDQRRILDFCVGVPSARQLLSLSEDADEIAIAISLDESAGTQPDVDTEFVAPYISLIRERAQARVIRHYRPLLSDISIDRSVNDNAETLAVALANDIRERFLFDSPTETQRWISAQQHAEARRYWCQAMLVGLVGKDADAVWPELAASIWGAAAWRRSDTTQQIATWCRETLQRHRIVLQLEVSKAYIDMDTLVSVSTMASKPTTDAVAKRDAKIAQSLDSEVSRHCDLCELAVALDELHSPALKLRGMKSDPPRWFVFDAIGRSPLMLPVGAENRLFDLVDGIER